jgi:hypothetical protein
MRALIHGHMCNHQRPGSADHLVGLEEQRRGNGQAKHFRGLEVDDQLEFGGLLHR